MYITNSCAHTYILLVLNFILACALTKNSLTSMLDMIYCTLTHIIVANVDLGRFCVFYQRTRSARWKIRAKGREQHKKDEGDSTSYAPAVCSQRFISAEIFLSHYMVLVHSFARRLLLLRLDCRVHFRRMFSHEKHQP